MSKSSATMKYFLIQACLGVFCKICKIGEIILMQYNFHLSSEVKIKEILTTFDNKITSFKVRFLKEFYYSRVKNPNDITSKFDSLLRR